MVGNVRIPDEREETQGSSIFVSAIPHSKFLSKKREVKKRLKPTSSKDLLLTTLTKQKKGAAIFATPFLPNHLNLKNRLGIKRSARAYFLRSLYSSVVQIIIYTYLPRINRVFCDKICVFWSTCPR